MVLVPSYQRSLLVWLGLVVTSSSLTLSAPSQPYQHSQDTTQWQPSVSKPEPHLQPPESSDPDLSMFNQSFDQDAVFDAIDLDDSDGLGDPSMPGWTDPRKYGGTMLDLVGNGLREPVNVIISGKSDPHILSDQGLRDYVRTIGFSFECLNLHIGGLQRADVGDGKGWTPEMFEYRQTQLPGAPGRWVGACWESLYGGNHFRAWKQNGTLANTGAWFLAVSKEKNLRYRHTIDTDGYNVGRDLLVAAALTGGTWKSFSWKADVEWIDHLLQPGRHGINHNISQDGRTAILTVYPTNPSSSFFPPLPPASFSPLTSTSSWSCLSISSNFFTSFSPIQSLRLWFLGLAESVLHLSSRN